MKEFLLFQLYGPFVSWGDIAVGENRHSFSHPTKSAIMGMIAASLGIKRDEESNQLELNHTLGFSTQVFSTGLLLRDFHTVQTPTEPKKPKVSYYSRKDELSQKMNVGTIITNRDYRCDAYSLVGIWCRKEGKYSLSNIQAALLNPKFVLYLGRKSCVISLPLNPKLIQSENLLSAYSNYPIQKDFLESLGFSNYIQMYWEDFEDETMSADQIQTRRDSLLRKKSWQFTDRKEFYKSIIMEPPHVPNQT
jgi:CRISPR system Cascade subunit CasD